MKINNKTIKRLKNDYGNWVLITGATSGIGKEIAITLGEAGFNLIITGRNEQELNFLSKDLFRKYHVKVIPLKGDLSQKKDIEHLLEETTDLPIGIVILNAGFGTSGKFINSNINTELNMLDLNCKSVLQVFHHFANEMKNKSRKGAFVLLSSMVAFQGVPNAANYAASKAYIQTLGEGLAKELKPIDIDVLCVAPGPVQTGFSLRANMKMGMSLLPQDIVVPIINAIGKKNTLLPGVLTKFLVYSLRLLPRWGKISVMEKVMHGFTKHQV